MGNLKATASSVARSGVETRPLAYSITARLTNFAAGGDRPMILSISRRAVDRFEGTGSSTERVYPFAYSVPKERADPSNRPRPSGVASNSAAFIRWALVTPACTPKRFWCSVRCDLVHLQDRRGERVSLAKPGPYPITAYIAIPSREKPWAISGRAAEEGFPCL